MANRVHYRRQGDIGEAAAIEWLTRAGANILIPLFHSPDYDLVADMEGRLVRVQVKTSGCIENGRLKVQLCTRGGNRSGTGRIKLFDSTRCDYLFVAACDGRRWLIPAGAVEAGHCLRLGGAKYACFEVTDSRIQAENCRPIATLDAARGDVRVVKGDGL